MSHSSTVSFLSYWRALQQGAAQNSPLRIETPELSQLAPLRADFDPVQLKDLMPQMMMIATSGNDYRFRLTGGFLVALHGAGLKTTSFTKLFAPAHEEQLKVALNLATHRQQPLILTASAATSRNETVRFDIALAPLRNASGDVDRMVGLYQPQGPIPFLRRATVTTMTLHSVRLYDPERLPRESHLRLVSVRGQLIA
ncbi:PAS domain-containing protein [Asticcacaulis machinosus]|uniref:PAS domain-containing protein n=1 Tax=Asticcacaulis machinosus TaxID=2984211 RepID=A0ABT5HNG2_9CAUL|nr:PAS domain-containing protein [Asticcacaulis machinosus]MDC7677760.1 PAS domain-containing protein [Asticcacaulis machinosus]